MSESEGECVSEGEVEGESVSEGEGESEGSKHTLSLDLESSKAGHPHAFLGRRRVESDSPELLRRFFRVAEVQLHQILCHSKARQPPCQTRSRLSVATSSKPPPPLLVRQDAMLEASYHPGRPQLLSASTAVSINTATCCR